MRLVRVGSSVLSLSHGALARFLWREPFCVPAEPTISGARKTLVIETAVGMYLWWTPDSQLFLSATTVSQKPVQGRSDFWADKQAARGREASCLCPPKMLRDGRPSAEPEARGQAVASLPQPSECSPMLSQLLQPTLATSPDQPVLEFYGRFWPCGELEESARNLALGLLAAGLGEENFVQRCRNHKVRNILGHLPKDQHEQARATLKAAWKLDADEGIQKIEQYASWLERDWPSAAASLREGLAEMFTINRLGLPSSLRRCLGSTNLIDNSHSALRERTRPLRRRLPGGAISDFHATSPGTAKVRTSRNSRRPSQRRMSGSRIDFTT